MSVKLDAEIANTGTRFKIFAQPRYLKGFEEPETVIVSVPAGEVQAGPADDRMYVVDAINKRQYEGPYRPPYSGPKNDPVQPGSGGHFDHLAPESREFMCAQMYATIRRVLDIWQDYMGRRIEWHFNLAYPRLELVPLVAWDNAQSGDGYLEFGYCPKSQGAFDLNKPLCMNFDVLAHELGHSLVWAEVGSPDKDTWTYEYDGFNEAVGDLIAIFSSLHFNQMVDKLLKHSKGNLFTPNELSRVGELSQVEQVRLAFNWKRMSKVGTECHELSMPLTGAVFDIFVEIYQKRLVEHGLISQDLADRSFHDPEKRVSDEGIQAEFDAAYTGQEEAFKQCLLIARDNAGVLMARCLDAIGPNHLTYAGVGNTLLSVDRAMGGTRQQTIRDCFSWREIQYPPDSPQLRSHKVL